MAKKSRAGEKFYHGDNLKEKIIWQIIRIKL